MNTSGMLRRIHPATGTLATALILVFWISTTVTLIFGTPEQLVTVKHSIAWGLVLLVPALAATGATGFLLGRHSHDPRVLAKRRRMAIIAAVGLLVLVPCVLYLAGCTNVTLMSLNIRDGLQFTGRLHRRTPATKL